MTSKVLSVFTTTAMVFGIVASAGFEANAANIDDPIVAVTQATPDTVANASNVATLGTGASAINSTVGGVAIIVPTDADVGISLSKGSTQIKIGLPNSDKADKSRSNQNGVVLYKNNDSSSTVPVVMNDGSVQINTVIANASTPVTYSYPVILPDGGTLKMDDNGSVAILDASNTWVAGIAPAWAKDATGQALPTSYSITGNTVTQTVDFSGANVKFPVVADPWFGIDLIDHTTWANLWEYSPTLRVFPTLWGRNSAGALANGAAWSETLKKTARFGHPNPNTSAMQVQFDCHWLVVRVLQVSRASWNLDSKLPWTDLVNEIRYGCNYPTGNRNF